MSNMFRMGSGDPKLQEKTIASSMNTQVVTFDSDNYDGLSKVTVTGMPTSQAVTFVKTISVHGKNMGWAQTYNLTFARDGFIVIDGIGGSQEDHVWVKKNGHKINQYGTPVQFNRGDVLDSSAYCSTVGTDAYVLLTYCIFYYGS